MENIRTVLMAVVGLAAVAVLTVFAASVGLALMGVLFVLSIARLIAMKLDRATVPVKTREQRKREAMRVWDDGRGKIIDL
ncbi:hypothetical protein [Martelella mediterranea]|uniref:Uncharacterized protein n=1 Tax=Martelella mediterranea TaxID=293089 RepID=A0A4R3NUE9_9HYPH|nr:hypothetical protein [Martelella mediterranea]TCT41088.1 hypothetical protein EDC90_100764 [Martelella mediterranea]